MPDRATIEAATPKCPHVPNPLNRPIQANSLDPCGQLLHYNAKTGGWECEEHGKVRTEHALVRSQRAAVADGIAG